MPAPYPYGELALLHLLASDLQTVQTMMEQAGRRTIPISEGGREELLVEPDARDGFVFAIRQQPVEMWLGERTARTGEKLEIEESARKPMVPNRQ